MMFQEVFDAYLRGEATALAIRKRARKLAKVSK